MTKDEALKLALEALEQVRDANIIGLTLTQNYYDAITAIKEALAQPEPEHTFTYDQVKAHIQAAMISEREACANSMAKIVMIPTYTHGALVKLSDVVNAIRARGNVATNDTSQERVDKTSESVHEPWSPVSIGVDVTKEGAHVVGLYALDKDTSQIFYAKHHPAPQRTWVGLTDEEIKAFDTWHDNREEEVGWVNPSEIVAYIEAKLKEKNR